jgi:uncharacterized protein with PIN domain
MRFIADNTVGKLRRWLGLLGYDIVYDPRPAREIVRDPAVVEGPWTVLGRCPTLADEQIAGSIPGTTRLFFPVESPVLTEQIREIARVFPLDFAQTLFSRCTLCNLPLEGPMALDALPVPAREAVPPLVVEWRDRYFYCPVCQRAYWEGTHTGRIREVLRSEVGLEF